MTINSFKDLTVWQKSMDLVESVYTITTQLPSKEQFGLSSQLQRAAVSVPSNIAEGSKRSSRADFRHFCKIALGSAAEIETQLLIAVRLYGIPVNDTLALTIEVQKMLGSLERSLNQKLQTTN